MNQENKPAANKDMHPALGLTFIIGFVAAIAWLVFSLTKEPPQVGLQAGTPAPEITAQGWINGEAPTQAEIKGKVIVVEAWATWCIPCRMHAPELVKDHEKYKDNPDVMFIGLTSDDHSSLRKIESFIREHKITWRNGYGAFDTLNNFKAEYIPVEWVIDRQGKIVWSTGDSGSLIQAIDKALAKN